MLTDDELNAVAVAFHGSRLWAGMLERLRGTVAVAEEIPRLLDMIAVQKQQIADLQQQLALERVTSDSLKAWCDRACFAEEQLARLKRIPPLN